MCNFVIARVHAACYCDCLNLRNRNDVMIFGKSAASMMNVAVKKTSEATCRSLELQTKTCGSGASGASDIALMRPAARIYAMPQKLSVRDVLEVERYMSFLSDAQIEFLANNTDLSRYSVRFVFMVQAKLEVNQLFKHFSDGNADEQARLMIPRLIAMRTLTPSMAAKLQAILLTGYVSGRVEAAKKKSKHLLPHEMIEALSNVARAAREEVLSLNTDGQLKNDVEALRALHYGTGHVVHNNPKQTNLFVHATAYELADIHPDLVKRLVHYLGKETFEPFVARGAGKVEELLADQASVQDYLSVQRVASPIRIYQPTATTQQAIGVAQAALQAADDFTIQNNVSVASDPLMLAQAREFYRIAADHFHQVMRLDPQAIQDPIVHQWTERRLRSLIVYAGVVEAQSPTAPGVMHRFGRRVVKSLGMGRFLKPIGIADEQLHRQLYHRLNFRPNASLTPSQLGALVNASEERLILEGWQHDPLTQILLEPQIATQDLRHAHLLFAPGVVPITGVFGDVFTFMRDRFGIRAHVAKTGFFRGEKENAQQVRKSYQQILAQDPSAEVVLLGYSQGMVNALTFLDDMRSGSLAEREAASHVRAVASLYGAHNGSPAADFAAEMLKLGFAALPDGGRRELDLLSANWTAANILAGGVDSLQTATRQRFWQRANLPSDIPYVGFVAESSDREVPTVLKFNFAKMRQVLKGRGLPESNDTQVAACDASLGNNYSEIGQAVHKQSIMNHVRGHHWNPLRPEHMHGFEPAKYAYPKLPQVAGHVLLLAEIGSIGSIQKT